MQINPLQFQEWDHIEDKMGVVWCLGRKQNRDEFEAVAAYLKSTESSATKLSITNHVDYQRIMYHGLPEESAKLGVLPTEIKDHLLSNFRESDSHLYLHTAGYHPPDRDFAKPTYWMDLKDEQTAPLRRSLETALETIVSAGMSLDKISLYGGTAFGLINPSSKHVDDVDLLLNVTTESLKQLLDKHKTPYTWSNLNPGNLLSERRLKLKAKRWSTSQIRLSGPAPLSIDLKLARPIMRSGLWDNVDLNLPGKTYSGVVRVIDDGEGFFMSPALRGIDESGRLVTILMKGYSYVGCAINGDVIHVKGTRLGNSEYILVTQLNDDVIIPDLKDVPIS